MSPRRPPLHIPSLVLGLLLCVSAALGLAWGLGSDIHWRRVGTWSPVALIIIGLIGLMAHRNNPTIRRRER